MELRHLHTFVMVARTRQLNHAAVRLGLRPSALSAHIKALEDELGLKLFERTRSGMCLTGAAEAMLPLAENVVENARAFLADAHRIDGRISGQLSIGTITRDPEFLGLGPLCATLCRSYPDLQVEMVHGVSGRVWEGVRNGVLDAGFFIGHNPDRAIAAMELREVHYCIAAPPQWREKIAGARWQDVVGLPWVWGAASTSYSMAAKALFRQQKWVLPRRIVFADDEEILVNAVRDGIGLSVVREDLARHAAAEGKLVIWRGARTTLPLSFISLASRGHDPAIDATLRVVAELLRRGFARDDGAGGSHAVHAA